MKVHSVFTFLSILAITVNAAPYFEDYIDEDQLETFDIRVDDLSMINGKFDELLKEFSSINLDPKSYYCADKINDEVTEAIFAKDGLNEKIIDFRNTIESFEMWEYDFFCT